MSCGKNCNGRIITSTVLTTVLTDPEAAAKAGDDVMTRLASVRFPDGELPEVADVVRLAVPYLLRFLAEREEDPGTRC